MTAGPPPAAASASEERNSWRASGSSAATGSSSSSSRGCLASARLRPTCARCPPDRLPTGRVRGIFSAASRSVAAPASQCRFSRAKILRWSPALSRRYSGMSWAR